MSLFCMFPLQIISFLGKNLQSSADSHISKVKLYKQTNKNERDRIWRKWPCVSQSAWKEIIDSFLFPSTFQYKYTTKEAKKTRRMKNKKNDMTMGMVPPLCCCRWSFWRSPQGNNSYIRFVLAWNLYIFDASIKSTKKVKYKIY